ncbi:GNAT family N-acetyltransferase [Streptomyces sp. BP-8]|uniref:GNAT family N-acetyltransferase n=1 Tax=Streptomyces sirii TaxID=3127701 RepID=UPI00388ED36F
MSARAVPRCCGRRGRPGRVSSLIGCLPESSHPHHAGRSKTGCGRSVVVCDRRYGDRVGRTGNRRAERGCGRAVALTIAPDARRDEELARRLVDDVTAPERGVLPEGKVNIESPVGALVQDLLFEDGWKADEPWTPLRRDLTEPVRDPGVRIEVVGPERAHMFAAVVRAAFDGSTFTDERRHAMATGSPYADARCLLAFDERGDAVAGVTVWSAGRGRPGLLEPMGVHREHRRQGYGEAISLAAAAALQELGSSSALACTPSSDVGAVATYKSAGFRQRPEVRDQYRDPRISCR